MKIQWHIGDVIAKVREERGMKKKELAKKARLSPNAVGNIERTGNCHGSTLKDIAAALNISVAELYSNEPKAAQEQAAEPAKHDLYHRMLDIILEGPNDFWKVSIMGNLRAMSHAVTALPLEGNDVRIFSAQDEFLPGDAIMDIGANTGNATQPKAADRASRNARKR